MSVGSTRFDRAGGPSERGCRTPLPTITNCQVRDPLFVPPQTACQPALCPAPCAMFEKVLLVRAFRAAGSCAFHKNELIVISGPSSNMTMGDSAEIEAELIARNRETAKVRDQERRGGSFVQVRGTPGHVVLFRLSPGRQSGECSVVRLGKTGSPRAMLVGFLELL